MLISLVARDPDFFVSCAMKQLDHGLIAQSHPHSFSSWALKFPYQT